MVTLADTTFRYKSHQLGFIYDRMVKVRSEMLEMERLFGLKHELTVAKSQELDLIINEYMKHSIS
ncbi:MAG: aspartyl-phosphate phosphatase Spo0E family protein [Turicibacter sp.]|nr:aspartyl-phosphate phosphatase Spo0E family protein [Turicibacter sp.]